MALLEVDSLTKHFHLEPGLLGKLVGGRRRRTIKAVESVSFSMERGEILGIAGESGCGKSTTCLLIARLHEPTAGSIRYEGREVSNLTGAELREYRRQVQIIFQDPYESLNPRFTVFDIVAEGPRALLRLGERDLETRVLSMLERVGLEPAEYRDRYPHQMSGGERQRVGIASALVLEPRLVIADEPLSMLDVSIRAGILDLIRDLSRQMHFTCIYVSHDLSILANISQRLMVMYLGQIAEIGPTHQLIENPYHPYTQALVSAVPVPDPRHRRKRPDIRGDVSQPIDPPPGCRFAPRCPQVMDICRVEFPALRTVGEDQRASCHLYEEDRV